MKEGKKLLLNVASLVAGIVALMLYFNTNPIIAYFIAPSFTVLQIALLYFALKLS